MAELFFIAMISNQQILESATNYRFLKNNVNVLCKSDLKLKNTAYDVSENNR